MTKNLHLRIAILETGRRERELAKRAGMSQTKFSNIKRGYSEPTEDDKKALARVLKRTVAELFPPKSTEERQAS